jgi:hypothetical protein
MGRELSEDAQIRNPVIHRVKHTWGAQTLTGTLTLTAESPDILDLDPGGASRNVVLPADAADLRGRKFYIYNSADAAENLVIKQSDGSTTVITIAQGKAGEVWLSGNVSGTFLWRGLLGS